MIGPSVLVTDDAALPFAERDVGVCAPDALEEAEGEVAVCGWEEAGDARGIEEAVCGRGGGEDGAEGGFAGAGGV